MKKISILLAVLALALALSVPAMAADGKARVRAVHASPDAPAVDVLVNDSIKAFSNAPFTGITPYAELDPATYNVKVVPTGATEPVVINADLTLAAGTDYTVVAVGKLANIEPLVLVDNNSTPAAGKAHVRFVHASPDAPSVDIAVQGGPILFSNVPFKGVGDYLPVDAGTYNLEVRVHDSGAVVLTVPNVALADRTVYTIFAMGLAGGDPALRAVPSVDAAAPAAPAVLPTTGAGPAEMAVPYIVLALGLAVLGGGLLLRRRAAND
jgi:hypothetical protein